MRVLIDTDPGSDDALALMMALASPELDILAITTVGGNATLAHTTRNALRLLEHLGRPDIPVCRGASRPLRGSFHYGYYFHGPAGLTARLPLPKTEPAPLRAPDYIVQASRAFPGELALLALGPLTNVARAMAAEPRVTGWIKQVVIMGGAVGVDGNVTPHAEFNVYNDPRAAKLVFASGIPITLVGLDVCNRVYAERGDWARLRTGSRSAKLASRILANWFASHPERDRYHLCDPMAVVALLQPRLLTFRQATVSVETEATERMGKTSARYGLGNVKVATAVHTQKCVELIYALLRGCAA